MRKRAMVRTDSGTERADVVAGLRAALDEVSGTAIPEEEREHESLDAMLGEAISLGDIWPGRYYYSPKVRMLRRILNALNAAELAALTDPLAACDANTAILQKLVRVPEGEGLRPVTADEVEEAFDIEGLGDVVAAILRKDGVRVGPAGNG